MVVIEVFVAQRQTEDTLAEHGLDPMLATVVGLHILQAASDAGRGGKSAN
ncbi:hypothetical protein [Halomonas sp. BM-2019]|nr:MAG: hypothetical protein J5F18_01830 [Halomonas sp. BM-2019]